MKTDLTLEWRNPKNEDDSESCFIPNFEIPGILPNGYSLRFDVAERDSAGRWIKQNGKYAIDSGNPIRATVEWSEGQTCSQTQKNLDAYLMGATVEGDTEEREKLKSLNEFLEYLSQLSHCKSVKISKHRSEFSEKQLDFLIRNDCRFISEIADLQIESFHGTELEIAHSIEKWLKENFELMFISNGSSM